MSLINQVLRDLEKRHATRADVRGLPASVRPLPDAGGRGPWWLWVTGGLLLMAMTGVAVWWIWVRPTPLARMAPAPPPVSQAPAGGAAPSPPASPPRLAGLPEPSEPAATISPEPGAGAASTAVGRDAEPATQAAPQAPGPAGAEPATAVTSEGPSAVASLAEGRGTQAGTGAPPAPIASTAPAPSTKPAPRRRPPARPPATTAEEAAPLSSAAAEPAGSIDKQVRPLSAQVRAEAEFRRGMSLLQQGRSMEAEDALHMALAEQPVHEQARQALLGLLLEGGRRPEAEALLQDGLRTDPRQINLAMLLARLQVDRGALQEAIDTLQTHLPNAQWSADYLAMTAAVMARASRNREAAQFYEAALRIGPNNAVWTMGLGLALRGDGRPREALVAFQRARDLKTLAPELQAFVERQIRDLQ